MDEGATGPSEKGPEAGLERSRVFVRRETRGMNNVACSQFPGNSMNTKYEVGRSVEPPRRTLPASRSIIADTPAILALHKAARELRISASAMMPVVLKAERVPRAYTYARSRTRSRVRHAKVASTRAKSQAVLLPPSVIVLLLNDSGGGGERGATITVVNSVKMSGVCVHVAGSARLRFSLRNDIVGFYKNRRLLPARGGIASFRPLPRKCIGAKRDRMIDNGKSYDPESVRSTIEGIAYNRNVEFRVMYNSYALFLLGRRAVYNTRGTLALPE